MFDALVLDISLYDISMDIYIYIICTTMIGIVQLYLAHRECMM